MNALRRLIHFVFGRSKANAKTQICAFAPDADKAANWPVCDADHNGTNAVLPPDADSISGRLAPNSTDADKPRPPDTLSDADLVSNQFGSKPPADSISGRLAPNSTDKRARNLAKLEARKAEAAAKHRATMATKPGARS